MALAPEGVLPLPQSILTRVKDEAIAAAETGAQNAKTLLSSSVPLRQAARPPLPPKASGTHVFMDSSSNYSYAEPAQPLFQQMTGSRTNPAQGGAPCINIAVGAADGSMSFGFRGGTEHWRNGSISGLEQLPDHWASRLPPFQVLGDAITVNGTIGQVARGVQVGSSAVATIRASLFNACPGFNDPSSLANLGFCLYTLPGKVTCPMHGLAQVIGTAVLSVVASIQGKTVASTYKTLKFLDCSQNRTQPGASFGDPVNTLTQFWAFTPNAPNNVDGNLTLAADLKLQPGMYDIDVSLAVVITGLVAGSVQDGQGMVALELQGEQAAGHPVPGMAGAPFPFVVTHLYGAFTTQP